MHASQKQIDYLTDMIQIERNKRRVWSKLSGEQSAALLADMQARVVAETERGIDGARASQLIEAAKSLGTGPRAMLVALAYTQEQIASVITSAKQS